jgi:DNA-binding IclR family transcriptional regulator
MSDTPLVQSLERAFAILDCVADAPCGARLSDIARQLALKVPTAHNLMRSLVEHGYLSKDADGRYLLGPAVERLARQRGAACFMTAVEAALTTLARLEPDAVLNYSHLDGAAMVESRYWDPRVRALQQRGVRHHPYASASGLTGQAYADDAALAELRCRHPFHEHGAHLWGTLEALTDGLRRIRDTRLCQPAFPGSALFLAAVPILGRHDHFAGVLGTALPWALAADAAVQARVIAHLTQAAQSISP